MDKIGSHFFKILLIKNIKNEEKFQDEHDNKQKNNYKPLKNIGVKKDNDCFLFLSINQVAFKKN
jgi:hypothetical protein